ncbi:MAG: phosphoribulokinase [Acidiferrobacterales bacterium]|nr:phosphoribulokinase [Acidiferrobacterales bacterium]
MSKLHPIVAITGSSGAGTTTVKGAFDHIFHRDNINVASVSGDCFHLHTREEFERILKEGAQEKDGHISHFGPQGNDFRALERLFETYGLNGSGQYRYYLHDLRESRYHSRRFNLDLAPGEFTPYEDIPAGTDLLFYEGLHGMVRGEGYDVAQHVDLGVGVVPIVNLEWIQKLHRDRTERGHNPEDIVETILRRMPDYVNHITPQFSLTDINFQRVSTVDTSNPFIARDIPTLDESFVVIRFRDVRKFHIDFPYLLAMIEGSFMSRRNTIVVPGGKMGFAIEIIFGPILQSLLHRRG